MKPAIEIRNLGKEYKLATSQPYVALRDVISGSVKNIFRAGKKPVEKFWALQDINLDIQPGERIGIIGRNGAGKSTLLKIISRITPPTTGSATIRGRVGSLLEVGTGFHPELSGRENIYLNGSILGLKKAEITCQFDAIVDFSGIEKFIDTPLKHYSSGMQLRLAFSVAAHLEPEILLIDEVLAVGDMEFQKKCIGKMEEVSKQDGRTILFVSHNINFIQSLCNKGVLLEKGKIDKVGPIDNIVSHYLLKSTNKRFSAKWEKNHPGDEVCKLISLRMIDENRNARESFSTSEKIGIEMTYEVMKDEFVLWLGHNVHNLEGVNIFDTHSVNSGYYTQPHEKGNYVSVVWIPANVMNTGNFIISSAIFNHLKQVIHFHEKDILLFNIFDDVEGITARGMSPGKFPGLIRPLLTWDIVKKK
jgi:lipopolysaccharide transport system ATP-binding protein